MKKYIQLVIFLVTLLLCSVAVDASSIKVSVESGIGKIGDVIEIPIVLSGNIGFSNLGIEIDYDNAALKLISATPNSMVGAICTKAQNITAKPYNFSWNSTTNNGFNGTIATLKFEIISGEYGEYPITVSYYRGRDGIYLDGSDVNYDESFNSLNLSYVTPVILLTMLPEIFN